MIGLLQLMVMARGLSRSARVQVQCEYAVATFGLNAIDVDLDGQGDRAVELPASAFAAMHARLLARDFTVFLPAMRMVLSLTSMRKSAFATPGTSVMMMMSSPLRNTLSGG